MDDHDAVMEELIASFKKTHVPPRPLCPVQVDCGSVNAGITYNPDATKDVIVNAPLLGSVAQGFTEPRTILSQLTSTPERTLKRSADLEAETLFDDLPVDVPSRGEDVCSDDDQDDIGVYSCDEEELEAEREMAERILAAHRPQEEEKVEPPQGLVAAHGVSGRNVLYLLHNVKAKRSVEGAPPLTLAEQEAERIDLLCQNVTRKTQEALKDADANEAEAMERVCKVMVNLTLEEKQALEMITTATKPSPYDMLHASFEQFYVTIDTFLAFSHKFTIERELPHLLRRNLVSIVESSSELTAIKGDFVRKRATKDNKRHTVLVSFSEDPHSFESVSSEGNANTWVFQRGYCVCQFTVETLEQTEHTELAAPKLTARELTTDVNYNSPIMAFDELQGVGIQFVHRKLPPVQESTSTCHVEDTTDEAD